MNRAKKINNNDNFKELTSKIPRVGKNKTVSYMQVLNELLKTTEVKLLAQFKQHKVTNTYTHCRHVALISYKLVQRFHLHVNEEALAVGAVFHDYYLYDIKEQNISDYFHGRTHANTAIENVEKFRKLTDLEKGIIKSHMWPLPFIEIPKSKEAWIVCLADKICAIQEMHIWKEGEHK